MKKSSANNLAQKNAFPAKKLLSLLIGIVIATIFSVLPGPMGITKFGMITIGVFLVANYWFTTMDMATGALAGAVLFVILSGGHGAELTYQALATPTIWQFLMLFPFMYALQSTGAAKIMSDFLLTRKSLYGKPWRFVTLLFMIFTLGAFLKMGIVNIVVIAEAITVAAGYERRTKEHDLFMVGCFLASSAGMVLLPYTGLSAMMIAAVQKATGIEIDLNLYLAVGIIIAVVLNLLYVLQLKTIFRCDFSKFGGISPDQVAKQGDRPKDGIYTLIIFFVMIAGMVISSFFSNFVLSKYISQTLTTSIWMAICLLALTMIPINGKPVVNLIDGLKNGTQWPLFFSCAVMVVMAGFIGSEEAGIRTALTQIFSSVFSGLPGILLVVCASAVCVLVTGFFSNMATATIACAAIIPIAVGMNMNAEVLAVCLIWASMPGYLTPGGIGQAPILHGMESITKKNMYKGIVGYLVAYVIVIVLINYVIATIM